MAPMIPSPCVYFVRSKQTGLIKIGTTRQLGARVRNLELDLGRLELLGVLEGGNTRERELQEKFLFLRTAGEWFTASKPLLDFIANDTIRCDPLDSPLKNRVFLHCEIAHDLRSELSHAARLAHKTMPELLDEILRPELARRIGKTETVAN